MSTQKQSRQVFKTAERAKQPHEKHCEECAAIISRKAEICPHCGVRLLLPPQAVPNNTGLLGQNTQNGKNKVVAALLAFFLGGFGVHKFYLGQIGFGILYLVFCWTLIPSLIAFVEFIILLAMDDHVFEEKYGRYDSKL